MVEHLMEDHSFTCENRRWLGYCTSMEIITVGLIIADPQKVDI